MLVTSTTMIMTIVLVDQPADELVITIFVLVLLLNQAGWRNQAVLCKQVVNSIERRSRSVRLIPDDPRHTGCINLAVSDGCNDLIEGVGVLDRKGMDRVAPDFHVVVHFCALRVI